jgi:hypothetical protein
MSLLQICRLLTPYRLLELPTWSSIVFPVGAGEVGVETTGRKRHLCESAPHTWTSRKDRAIYVINTSGT